MFIHFLGESVWNWMQQPQPDFELGTLRPLSILIPMILCIHHHIANTTQQVDDSGGMEGSSACSIFSGVTSVRQYALFFVTLLFSGQKVQWFLKNKNALKNSSNQNWNPSFIMEYIFQMKCNVSFFYFWKKTQIWGIKNDNMSEKCCQTCQKVSY